VSTPLAAQATPSAARHAQLQKTTWSWEPCRHCVPRNHSPHHPHRARRHITDSLSVPLSLSLHQTHHFILATRELVLIVAELMPRARRARPAYSSSSAYRLAWRPVDSYNRAKPYARRRYNRALRKAAHRAKKAKKAARAAPARRYNLRDR
jgi:hypothetical protein